jgi:hypothetical protein
MCKTSIVAFCISFLIITALSSNVQAQEFHFDLDFNVGVPQGEFSDEIDRLGWGLGLMGGYKIPETPLMVGLDFGFMNFGIETRTEPLSTTIPDITVDVENSYNLVTGNLVLRLNGPPSKFRPYIDGLFGFNYFFTQTVLRERGAFSEEDVLRDTNFEDTSLSYGFGTGINLRVYNGAAQQSSASDFTLGAVYLNAGLRYMFGREAEYLQEGSITRNNGNVTFDVSRSETDLLYFKFGVNFTF